MVRTPEEAESSDREALRNSVEMIDQSDRETKVALQQAADRLHLKLPTLSDVERIESKIDASESQSQSD